MQQSLQTNTTQRLEQATQLSTSQLQSLNMLQATNLELQQCIKTELENNPVLELVGNGAEILYGDMSDISHPNGIESRERAATQAERDENYAYQANYDQTSDESFDSSLEPTEKAPPRSAQAKTREDFINNLSRKSRSFDELESATQELAGTDNQLLILADIIIGNLDPQRGYLMISDDELAAQTCLPIEKIHAFIKQLQDKSEPPGMFAHDLRECLLIQLEREFEKYTLAWRIVETHLDDLLHNRIPAIALALDCDVADINEARQRIAQLTPWPGRAYDDGTAPIIIPEATISKINGVWTVTMNQTGLPQVQVNAYYVNMVEDKSSGLDKESRAYLKNNLNRANQLLNAIEQRTSTIEKVTICIARRQCDFFEKGPEKLRPMTRADIAEDLGYSESTISRATANKYLQTPFGIMAYDHFFSSKYLSSQGDEDASAVAIKNKISEIIKSEPPEKPYSDQDISKQLEDSGYNVARRTVAKYREQLGFQSASNRKVYH